MSDFHVTPLDRDMDFDTLASWDVVIIGAGPAGLAAALTTAPRPSLTPFPLPAVAPIILLNAVTTKPSMKIAGVTMAARDKANGRI